MENGPMKNDFTLLMIVSFKHVSSMYYKISKKWFGQSASEF